MFFRCSILLNIIRILFYYLLIVFCIKSYNTTIYVHIYTCILFFLYFVFLKTSCFLHTDFAVLNIFLYTYRFFIVYKYIYIYIYIYICMYIIITLHYIYGCGEEDKWKEYQTETHPKQRGMQMKAPRNQKVKKKQTSSTRFIQGVEERKK